MNLLITRHDKIGDFVVTLPLFKAIKMSNPEIKVFALVSKINYDFAKEMDFIDEVILYEEDNFWSTLKRVKKAQIDISLSAFINTQLGYLLFLSGIKKRIGPATKLAQVFFNNRITQRRSKVEKTEFEYNLDLAKELDQNIKLEFTRPLIKLNVESSLKDFKKKFNISVEKRIIGFHPGYGGSSDGNLTLNDYIKLAKKASLLKNTQVVFTFGPDDLEVKKELENIIDFDVVFYESKGPIINFCKLLSSFELFISTSTGPMHLAGLANIKTISFFGNTLFASSKRWATISDPKNQNNFMLSPSYSEEIYLEIENKMIQILEGLDE
ncbi:glycosyltransferase family 9 protein [Arcobacter sp. LA11]|uniref:glycosyltransferase family 9 protein n=1 Tax=Arcobacter sp. LA11 TaxID=1898176 RepID=UPI00093426FD|nr:glycosyltransferase family 9 protein [Arcobacter sp. LA11]